VYQEKTCWLLVFVILYDRKRMRKLTLWIDLLVNWRNNHFFSMAGNRIPRIFFRRDLQYTLLMQIFFGNHSINSDIDKGCFINTSDWIKSLYMPTKNNAWSKRVYINFQYSRRSFKWHTQGVPEVTYQKENCISPSYYDQMSWFFFLIIENTPKFFIPISAAS
jgi:hypothetical protein